MQLQNPLPLSLNSCYQSIQDVNCYETVGRSQWNCFSYQISAWCYLVRHSDHIFLLPVFIISVTSVPVIIKQMRTGSWGACRQTGPASISSSTGFLKAAQWAVISERESHSVVSNSLRPHGLYSPWNSPGHNTGVDSCFLLQEILPTQGSNPGGFFTIWATREVIMQLSKLVGQRQGHLPSWSRFMSISFHCSQMKTSTLGSCKASPVYKLEENRLKCEWRADVGQDETF